MLTPTRPNAVRPRRSRHSTRLRSLTCRACIATTLGERGGPVPGPKVTSWPSEASVHVHDEDRRARDPVVGEVGEGPVGLLEGVGGRRRAEPVAGGLLEELGAVVS